MYERTNEVTNFVTIEMDEDMVRKMEDKKSVKT